MSSVAAARRLALLALTLTLAGSFRTGRRSTISMVHIPFPLPLKTSDQVAALAGAWQYTGPMPPFLETPPPGFKLAEGSAFLSLHENGTFVEAAGDGLSRPLLRGRWGVTGGRLVLAAERVVSPLEPLDTLFEGPMLAVDEQDPPGSVDIARTEGAPVWKAMAKVRKGEVFVGKFTYPPEHPRFLEDPMWEPEGVGTFELKQVLGRGVEMEGVRAKEQTPPGPPPPKYSKNELAGHWMLKVIPMAWTGARASLMLAELQLHRNGTWESTAGLGDNTVLRGRWGVYADAPARLWREDEAKDKIWVLVTRFGLGREKSYSCGVFSEGPFLNQDDDKMYIGAVREVTRATEVELGGDVGGGGGNLTEVFTHTLEAQGVVMLGLGLEPVSVGKFAMTQLAVAPDEGDEGAGGENGYWPSLIGRV